MDDLTSSKNSKKAVIEAEGKYKCEDCNELLSCIRTLRRHRLRKHFDSENYPCSLCTKKLKTLDDLKAHMIVHTKEKHFKCRKCEKSYKTKHDLKVHVTRSHEQVQGSKICPICTRSFYTTSHLNKHQATHLRPDERERNHECQFCEKKYYRKYDLEGHLKSHTGEKPRRCGFCRWTCITQDEMTEHTNQKHPKGPKLFNCDQCDAQLSSNSILKRHVERQHSEDGESKKRLSQQAQEYRKNALKRFKCSFCTKCFKTSSEANVHLRSHTGEKPFTCNLCNACFVTTSTLKIHVDAKHKRGEQNFNCSVCPKSFEMKRYLDAHVRKMHDESQQLPCSYCEKVCLSRMKLRAHEEDECKMRPERAFSCSHCSKKYSSKYQFAYHELTHVKKSNVKVMQFY